MEIIPAIDLRGGKVVRLYQGDYAQETSYGDDPVAVARRWSEEGATRLHVVDLDGARSGHLLQQEAIGAIVRATTAPVEVGGGVRSLDGVKALLDLGVRRVVLGTVAVEDPKLVAEACRLYGESIIVGIDAREGRVAVRGWLQVSSLTTLDLARLLSGMGVPRFILTDIGRDGTLQGPNVKALEEFVHAAQAPVIASGGVGTLDDIKLLAATKVEGILIGRALYTGAVKLPEALALVNS